MKHSFLLVAALGLALSLAGAPAWGDDFFVVASGGTSGKVLKTQVFTSNSTNNTLGGDTPTKLDSPQWTYTKLSATSYLVITYQDTLWCTGSPYAQGFYQLRANDLASVAGEGSGVLIANDSVKTYGATGVWPQLPKGAVILSIWHWHWECEACEQNFGGWTTTVTVMEIEK